MKLSITQIILIMTQLPVDSYRQILTADEIDYWRFWAGETEKAEGMGTIVEQETDIVMEIALIEDGIYYD